MAIIKQLTAMFNKTKIYPITTLKALFDENGNRMSDYINNNVLSSEDSGEDIEDAIITADRIGKYTSQQVGDIIDNFDDRVCAYLDKNPPIGYVNVKTFGAKGDGITDDTEAILSAFSKDNNVFFPKGIYLTRQIELTDKTDLSILGDSAVLLASSKIEKYLSVLSIRNSSNVTIKGLTIDGNKDVIPGSPSGGVFNCKFINTHDIALLDCKSINSYYGVFSFYDDCYNILVDNFSSIDTDCGLIFAQTQDSIDNASALLSRNVIIRNSYFEGGTSEGISLSTRANVDAETGTFIGYHSNFEISNCTFESKSSVGHAILLWNAKDVRIKSSIFKNSLNYNNTGVFIYSAENITVDSCYFEKQNTSAISMNKYSKDITIQNSCFKNNVIRSNGEFILIKGNVFIDCFTDPDTINITNKNTTIENNTFKTQSIVFEETTTNSFIKLSADITNVIIRSNFFDKGENGIYDIRSSWGTTKSRILIVGNEGITKCDFKSSNTNDEMILDGYFGYAFSNENAGQYISLKFTGNLIETYNLTFDGLVYLQKFSAWKPKEGTIVKYKINFKNSAKLMNSSNIQTKDGNSRQLTNGEEITFLFYDSIWHEI